MIKIEKFQLSPLFNSFELDLKMPYVEVLTGLDPILKLDSSHRKEAYVYVLTDSCKILYVGKTHNLKRRIQEHRRDINKKGFTCIFVVPLKKPQHERYWILELNPLWNKRDKSLFKMGKKYFSKVPSLSEKNISIRESNLRKNFINWLVGFLECKGYFHGVNDNRYFSLKMCKDDIWILKTIALFLGVGSINKCKGRENDIYYEIRSKKEIKSLISYLFGRIRSVKFRMDFNRWSGCVSPVVNYNFLSDAWLSGFLDGCSVFNPDNACRNVRSKKSRLLTLTCRSKELLECIIVTLELPNSVSLSNKNHSDNTFRCRIYGLNSFVILENYLSRYSLQTSKKEFYHKWLNLSKEEL